VLAILELPEQEEDGKYWDTDVCCDESVGCKRWDEGVKAL